ncbi:hypothetical protein HDK90DRAFT_156601 [Phyllosticta capitalensis]|uniref:RING-type domain-containing protein n=1 Tax=Phyllosticta capitalensis TaxID=121624 RepID=A0ABR1Z0F7_9PEZI
MGQSSSRGAAQPSGSSPSSQRSSPSRRRDAPSPSESQPSSRSSRRSLNFLPRLHSDRSDASSTGPANGPGLLRHRHRLSRAHSSISSILSRSGSTSRSRDRPERSSSRFSIPVWSTTSPHHVDEAPSEPAPRLHPPELGSLDFDDFTEAFEAESLATPPAPEREDNNETPSSWQRPTSLLDRVAGTVVPERTGGRVRNSLRRRRSPLRSGEDNAAMLSRLLSVAAAATAATLMGDDHRAGAEARNFVGGDEDGTFDGFLQSLQNGRIASALRGSAAAIGEESDTPGSPAPLNFFRMFRFGNTRRENASTRSSDSQDGSGESSEAQSAGEEGGEGRMVPIIIVGIRSITPNTGGGAQHDDNIPPFLDALSSFPAPITSGTEPSIDGILRQPQNGTRFSHRRRASMGGINTFPGSYDNQRHQRTTERPRPFSSLDTPPGPRPPPSTPSGLSAFSSGESTPSFTPLSDTPAGQSTESSRRESLARSTAAAGSGLDPPTEQRSFPPFRTARHRRLSESDHTRFGAGSSRRNGVVEPDHAPGEGPRSWIIYVLGGSYPENHPILTTPSLFTDAPTYEDMMLLSTLLGPAKPPVASDSDVASAGGIYTIREVPSTSEGEAEGLVASSGDGEELITIAADQRCLVCLSEYEVGEEARKLVQCGHLFHRECIDQWLTTGRNSCPLCRGQGVEEHEKRSNPPASPSTETSTAPTPATA